MRKCQHVSFTLSYNKDHCIYWVFLFRIMFLFGSKSNNFLIHYVSLIEEKSTTVFWNICIKQNCRLHLKESNLIRSVRGGGAFRL